MTDTRPAIRALHDLLGDTGCLRGSAMAGYCEDWRGIHRGEALLVARPGSTQEVAGVVNICRENDIVIVPQGGNTSLSGGSVPQVARPAVVLSLTRMNRVLSIDADGFSVTAEAGCTLQSLHDAAASADREFPMDWGARGTATVGGGIATNAGGINVLRFGNTREQVLGLEVVLPDGRVWNGLRALRKDSSGYDLKQLFIGAEGTLGVVTRAVIRLYPRPAVTQSMFAALRSLDRVNTLFSLARKVGDDSMTAFELVPGMGVERILEKIPSITRPIETRADWYALIRFSGSGGVEERLISLYEQAVEQDLIADAVIAQSLSQEQNLWHIRDEVPPGRLFRGKMLKWDASVPVDRVVEFIERAETIARTVHADCFLYAAGHVGDGNLHTSVFPGDSTDDEAWARVGPRIIDEVDRLIWSMNGSISAEHGIGVDNLARVRGQKSPLEFELMRSLRHMLDPDQLFNPGNTVPAEG